MIGRTVIVCLRRYFPKSTAIKGIPAQKELEQRSLVASGNLNPGVFPHIATAALSYRTYRIISGGDILKQGRSIQRHRKTIGLKRNAILDIAEVCRICSGSRYRKRAACCAVGPGNHVRIDIPVAALGLCFLYREKPQKYRRDKKKNPVSHFPELLSNIMKMRF